MNVVAGNSYEALFSISKGELITTVAAPPTIRLTNPINGRWTDSSASEWRDVVNPATGETLAQVQLAEAPGHRKRRSRLRHRDDDARLHPRSRRPRHRRDDDPPTARRDRCDRPVQFSRHDR